MYSDQSTASSVLEFFTECRIMQPLVEMSPYIGNTVELLHCKLFYCHSTTPAVKCTKTHYHV